jgi:uncharacterized protein (TIGR02147 family)
MPFYSTYLAEELNRRKRRNNCYSLRAFARSLGIDPAILSRAIAGKRSLSAKTIRKIIYKLNLTELEMKMFVESSAIKKMMKSLTK